MVRAKPDSNGTPFPAASLPRHIAIVMDGNGRWAQQRGRARRAGHQAGVRALRRIIEHCGRLGVAEVTVFAFSSENWRRPPQEVSRLLELFMRALDKEVNELHDNGVRVGFIGDLSRFPTAIQDSIRRAAALTRDNDRMALNVAVNYGGRWDIVQAARALAAACVRGEMTAEDIDEAVVAARLSLAGHPEPDLFIRTGGEQRISNFLLWQSAYTEFYFTPVLWPDFDSACLDRALADYAARERRFGRTGEQVRRQAG